MVDVTSSILVSPTNFAWYVMSVLQNTAFLLFVILLTKHLFFDFIAQTPFMLKGKGVYGHLGGIIHAGLHALSSLFILLLVTDIQTAGWIAALEFIIHYHMDWLKSHYTVKHQLTPVMNAYWWWTGVDQWVHHMTYALMVILALG